MELLDSFGFEPIFFTAQIINFLILAFIFKKFLYKPILKLLRDREKTISGGLEDAERARASLESANAQKDEIIKTATLEAENIIADTQKAAGVVREELLAKAKSEADRVIKESNIAAADELERATKEAKNMSIEISKKVLERVLKDFFTKEERSKILKRNLRSLELYE